MRKVRVALSLLLVTVLFTLRICFQHASPTWWIWW